MKTFRKVLSTWLAFVMAFSMGMNSSTTMNLYAQEPDEIIETASEEVPSDPVEVPQIEQAEEVVEVVPEVVNDDITDPEQAATEQETEPIEGEEIEEIEEVVEEEEEEIEQDNEVIPTSTNLTDFAYKMDGPDVGRPKKEMDYTIYFREGESLQFEDEGTLFYPFPEGVKGVSKSDTLNIIVTNDTGTYTISGNPYTVSENGITFSFNTSDPNYEQLTAAANTKFQIGFSATFDKSATFEGAGGSAIKDVTIDNSTSIGVNKSSYYDETDKKVHYTVTVVTNGMCSGVNVKDTITGSALTYNNDLTVTSKTWPGMPVGYMGGQSGNGFDITMQFVWDDTITLTYTADVDMSKVSGSSDYEVIKSELNNTVKVKSNELPNEIVKESQPQIDIFSIYKEGKANKQSDGSYLIDWKVTYNSKKQANVSGSKVTDTITNPDLHQYTGSVLVQKDGTQIDTFTPSGSSWEYTIPATDTASEYTFFYQTKVEADTLEAIGYSQTAQNHVTTDKNKEAYGSVNVEYDYSSVPRISKTFKEKTTEKATWTIEITVPKTGLSKAVLDEIVPTMKNGSTSYSDSLTSMKVTSGLVDGENASIEGNKITFTNGGNPGLKGTGEERKIVVTVETNTNQEWLAYSAETGESTSHTNKVDLVYKDSGSKVSGTATFTEGSPGEDEKPGVKKAYISKTDEKITWEITVTVPKTGLSKAVLEDIAPSVYANGKTMSDTVLTMNVISGLEDGEEASYADGKITFTKDGQPGLKATDNSRKIVVRVETQNNQEWLDYSEETGYALTHTNKAELTVRDNKKFTSEASTDIGGAVGVTKDYVSRDDETVTWKITVDVPKKGLSKAEVEDIVPGAWVGAASGESKDAIRSMKVTSGLLEGEDAEYVPLENGNGKLVFTKDGQPGLKSSDSARQVVITVVTEINEDWKQYTANTGLATTHMNTANLKLKDNVTLTDTAQVEIKGRPTSLTKDGKEDSFYDSTRGAYGEIVYGYHYWITFNNVSGDLVVNETFDTSLLTLVQSYSYIVAWNEGGESNNNHTPISFTENATGGQFTMSEEDLPKDSKGNFFEYYKIEYFLEKTATEEQLKEAAIKNGGIANLGNVVEYDGETAEKSFTWTYGNVSKELINKGEINSNNKVAKYKITINKDAIQMNNGDPMDFKDTYENLSIDYTTIKITDAEGNNIENVTHTYKGNTITFGNIPDGKTIIITYSATVTKNDNNVPISNTIEWSKYSSSSTEYVDVKSDGEGTASTITIRILKIDKDHNEKVLPNVQFQLFNGNGTPVTGKNGPVIVTTNAKGVATIKGSQKNDGWTLWPDREYYVQEVSSLPGYKANTTKYRFTVSESDVDYDQYIYYVGDILTVKNEKEKIDIPVQKVWASSIPESEQDEVTVKLKLGGQVVDQLVLSAENGWKDSFTGLEKYDDAGNEYKYTVVEETSDKFTAKITGDQASGYTITNNYPGHEVKISKQDIIGDEIVGAELAIIDATGAPVESWVSDGTVHKVELQPGTYTLTETNKLNGYALAQDIQFTVDTDGKVKVGEKELETIIMTDDYDKHTVKISKQDIIGEEIEGASLKVSGTTLDGKAIEEIQWTSGTTPTEIQLQPGTYTLEETNKLDNYELAQAIEFTVDVDGTVKVGEEVKETIIMTDDYDKHTVKISKQDIIGKEIEGASLKVSGTTLDGKAIEEMRLLGHQEKLQKISR